MEDLSQRLEKMTPLQRAVFALKETRARLESLEQKRVEPIAVIGMACRFPGGAHDPVSYWRLLCDGINAVGEIPPDRWNADDFYDPDPAAPGKMNTRWGGFIDGIDLFDNHFFGISDREAEQIDPQHRLMLELAWEAFEDAGLPASRLRGSRTGVFVGLSHSEYGIMLSSDLAQTEAFVSTGTAHCIAANRISYAFDLYGPSVALDTACSSSLVSVHLACQNIRNGDIDLALAGGVNAILSPLATVNLTKAGFSAADGRVRAFDAAATGYVRGEGAGVVVLKPLDAALKNGDPIYAVIRGSAINQNGHSNGLTAPSRQAQQRVLREAYRQPKLSPGRVQYVETQGTGTPLGDAIEATALGEVLQEDRAPGSRCAIGSVKTNIGHLEAASGIASLMKVALAMQHGQMPATLHFEKPNPDIPFERLPLKVQQKLEPWPASDQPKLAGVSAFGFGGSNAHVVLEEAPAVDEQGRGEAIKTEPTALAAGDESVLVQHIRPEASACGSQDYLLLLSARTDQAQQALAQRYADFLQTDPPPWRHICYSATARREHHDCRLAIRAASPQQAVSLLQATLDDSPPCHADPDRSIFRGRKPFGRDLKIALLFDGCAEPWRSLRTDATKFAPGLTAQIEQLNAMLQELAGWHLPTGLDDASVWDDPTRAPAAAVAMQLALTAWWQSVGVTPDVVLGRSYGELAAARAAGILTIEQALRVAIACGRGDREQAFAGLPCGSASLPFVSALDGRSHNGRDLVPAQWKACIDSADGLDKAIGELSRRQVDVCLEIGPPSLVDLAGEENQACLSVASLGAASGETGGLTEALGQLYAAGVDFTWDRIAPPGGRFVRLPTYPWQRHRLWADRKDWITRTAPPPATAGSAAAAHTPASDNGRPPREVAEGGTETGETRTRPDLNTPYTPPGTELEQQVAAAWQQVLGLDRVGIHDDFFELGGDSLQASILLNQVSTHLGRPVSLPLREMFELRTIATLSRRLEEVLVSGGEVETRTIPRVDRSGHLPLSLNQEALWFLDRLEPDRPTYLLYLALNVRGPVSLPTLERALNEIARRHECLRTTYPEQEGQPVQVIAAPESQTLPVVDLSHVPEGEREAEVRRRVAEQFGRAIDLQQGPLINLTLLRRAEDDYAAAVSTHHIIHDGWSMGILLHELAVLYMAFLDNQPSPLPELPVQYVDFAAWQRALLQGETLQQFRDYWQQQLAGLPALELPTDRPRPAIRTTRGSSRTCRLSPELSAAVWNYCRGEGVTPFMTLLAALQVLLARYSGQDDFAVGSPVANRNLAETEKLIGYFVNVVVLRADLDGDPTFRDLVERVQHVALDAFERQEMPLDQVVDAVKPARDPSRHPLFQVMFALQNIRLPSPPDLGLEITPLDDTPAPPSANFDLTLELFETPQGFQGSFNYNTDLFDANTIDRMVDHFHELVAAAVAAPDQPISQLPLITTGERQQVIEQWNDTRTEYDAGLLVHRRFEARAAAQPQAVAVVLDDQRWTYRQLNERANQLARYLQGRGVGPETTVGICVERSPELIMAVLAVLKAGGAYVPLDPSYAQDAAQRLQFMLDDAGVALVVTNSTFAELLADAPVRPLVLDGDSAAAIEAESVANLDTGPAADDLAYILYTSGSTGQPKGVMITHRSLLNAYCGWEQVYRLGSDVTSHLQLASFGFDVFAGDLVRALCSGGKLVLCHKEILLSPDLLLDLMERERVDIAEFVPVVLRSLVQYLEDTDQVLDFMRLVIVGSDAWYVADHQRAQRRIGPQTRLINSYGLTETTIDSCYFEGDLGALPPAGLVPIGRPFPNVRLYVLDDRGRPQPIGVPGELNIGGDGVARGYLDETLNATRFPPDPFAGPPAARMCRTGDRARWRADAQVEFLGRADDQVKIRGFRVEPGEVEDALRKHPSLAQAAVVACERSAGDLQLVAYTVPRTGRDQAGGGRAEQDGNAADVAQLRKFLGQRVPDYMIPSVFIELDALPMTASGKVDRRALPDPDWSRAAQRAEYVAPQTDEECQLAEIWSELLQVERVGANDNFFDLGGNSLMALRLFARIRTEFSVELPLVALFAASDLAGLSERIVQMKTTGRIDMTTLTPGPQVDWEAETQLDSAIRVTDSLRPAEPAPARVLLTGATGYLGAYVLRELLEQTGADVYCLVRAKDEAAARDKLARILDQYDLPGIASSERIVPVCGDLAQPQLGLSADTFAELSESIDAIYHNGAQVSVVAPYRVLQPANVAGTVEVLRLATLVKVKPVHFVSTISVFDSPQYRAMEVIDEAQSLEFVAELDTGYAQSKCVAEKLVRQAGARGLPVAIYRPGLITSDSATGAANLSDYVAFLIKLCIDLGSAPAVDEEVNMTPVDYVARGLVALSRLPDSIDQAFHFLNPQTVKLRDVYRAIRSSGYALEEVPVTRWTTDVIERGGQSNDDLLTAFSSLLHLADEAEEGDDTRAPAPPRVRIECDRTAGQLQGLSVSCPPVDAAVLTRFLDFLRRRGVLPAPASAPPAPPADPPAPPADSPAAPSLLRSGGTHRNGTSLVQLQGGGPGTPLFFIHGLGGHVAAFLPMAREFSDDRPVYALQAQGLDPGQEPQDCLEAMAAFYVDEIRGVRSGGPYLLAGWSLGGLIALEAAQQLTAAGEQVPLVAMFDTYLSLADADLEEMDDESVLRWIVPHLGIPLEELKQLPLEQKWERIAAETNGKGGLGMTQIRRLAEVCKAQLAAATRYEPQPYPGTAVLFQASQARNGLDKRWGSLCPQLQVERVPGDHFSMLRQPEVQVLVERLGRLLP